METNTEWEKIFGNHMFRIYRGHLQLNNKRQMSSNFEQEFETVEMTILYIRLQVDNNAIKISPHG